MDEFENLEIICNARIDTVLYNLPGERTGKRGRPRIRGERIDMKSVHPEKPKGADYYMGCLEVITNLWKNRHVYAYVTASDPNKSSSFRLFLCTAPSKALCVQADRHESKKIQNCSAWGMLPLGLYSIRWNIETGYYEMKSFWSLRDYMVRSVKGIERLINLICISYTACKLLPYYSMDFADYKGLGPQEVRYMLGEKIRMGIIMCSLEQIVETLKNDLSLKKVFQEFKRKCG